MRLAFLGNALWSGPPLEALAASSHELALVVTRGPRPAGRGGKPRQTPVAVAARNLALPLLEVDTVKSGPGFDALAGAEPHILCVVAYGEILPKAVLALPAAAPVNLHFSLLPELRGAAPVQRAILEGLSVTGVTTIWMDEGLDTGPILLQQEEAIDETDDAGSLGARLAAIGGRVLVDTIDRLESGSVRPRPQDEAGATYAPKLRPEEEWIDWTASPDAIVRRVRALSPAPGARTSFRSRTLKVFRASWRGLEGPLPAARQPGELVLLQGIQPACFAGGRNAVVVLEEVALEGRKRMSGDEFARGQRPSDGERLGL